MTTSSRNDWRPAAAYFYLLHLDASSLAWEYLRRNPDYQTHWARQRSGQTRAASSWGLKQLH